MMSPGSALPGEIFVELGLAIKEASPFRCTIIAELANGAIGYIPTKKAFEQGNYEPVSARCAPGIGRTARRNGHSTSQRPEGSKMTRTHRFSGAMLMYS
jgi:hypothetical protein